VTGPIDQRLAAALSSIFLEVVVAPACTAGALEVLAGKPNLRVVLDPALGSAARPGLEIRSAGGGLLVASADMATDDPAAWRPVTQRLPTEPELAALDFCWRVCRHVKSNAIVLARGRAVVGVGAGQMSRVDSVDLAVRKAAARSEGSVLSSDAFFPFEDGLQAAAAAGVTAVIQPGGSKRDPEVTAAADDADIAMVLTGVRHFRH
jgi:phosphoribosylaminoimidazolecarboxamide formyltransferase/IMP cyclohydrolase